MVMLFPEMAKVRTAETRGIELKADFGFLDMAESGVFVRYLKNSCSDENEKCRFELLRRGGAKYKIQVICCERNCQEKRKYKEIRDER